MADLKIARREGDTDGIILVDTVANLLGKDWHDEFLAYSAEGWLHSLRAAAHFLVEKWDGIRKENVAREQAGQDRKAETEGEL